MVVLIIGLFVFNESIGLWPILGTLIITLGLLAVNIGKNGKISIVCRGCIVGLFLSAVFYAINGLLLKNSLNYYGLVDTLMISRLGVFIGGLIIMILTRSLNFSGINKKSYIFAFSEVLYLVFVYLLILSLSKGSTATVYAVVNLQPLFVFVTSFFISRFVPYLIPEKFNFAKPVLAVVGIVLAIFGSYLLLA